MILEVNPDSPIPVFQQIVDQVIFDIASGGVDTTVQVWKAIDGTPISKYTGHSAEVEGVTWSPDSKHVASASDDQTVQLWQVP